MFNCSLIRLCNWFDVMTKRIKFIRGVLYPKVAKAYDVDVLDIDWSLKSTFLFQSYKDLDSEKLDEIINFLDQMLLEKNVDINEGY